MFLIKFSRSSKIIYILLRFEWEKFMKDNKRLEILLDFSEKIKTKTLNIEDEFWYDLYKTAKLLVPKADYSALFLNSNNHIEFLKIEGHDAKKIKKIKMHTKNFIDAGEKNKILISKNILEVSKEKEIHDKLKEATSPLKETLTFNFHFQKKFIAGVSLDIKEGSNKSFNKNDKITLNILLNLAEYFYQNEKYILMKRSCTRKMALTLVKTLEFRDKYTQGHSESVADISLMIAEEMNLSEKTRNEVYWSALLHDIGKISVPEEILNKNAKLTDEEYSLIMKHSKWGFEVLKESLWFEDISKNVLYHHERWDGKGYPKKLKGDKIPIAAQILAVADSYNAMVSERSYKKSINPKEAMEEIIKESGSQFSPIIVEKLKEIFEKGYIKGVKVLKEIDYSVVGIKNIN